MRGSPPDLLSISTVSWDLKWLTGAKRIWTGILNPLPQSEQCSNVIQSCYLFIFVCVAKYIGWCVCQVLTHIWYTVCCSISTATRHSTAQSDMTSAVYLQGINTLQANFGLKCKQMAYSWSDSTSLWLQNIQSRIGLHMPSIMFHNHNTREGHFIVLHT